MLGDKSRNRKNKTGGINVENQKRAYFIGGLAIAMVVAIVIWFACAGRSTVHDLRNGADAVRNELSNAESEQRKERQIINRTGEAIERSRDEIGESRKRIADSKRTNKEIKEIERSDRELIEENQRIIQRVRERGRTENKN